MAKTEKPNKGSQKETPIQGNKAEGVTFKDLISFATGSEAPTEEEFESTMAARGYRASDVRKLKKAFREVNSSGKDYFVRDQGFDVFDQNQRQDGSGRAKGNKQGADLGDLIGLGNDVSLLGGALRKEKAGYDKAQASKNQAQAADYSNEQLDGGGPQSLSPEMEFARTMKDLLAVSSNGAPKSESAPAGKGGSGSGKKAGKGAATPMKPGFELDQDLMNWSPFDVVTQPKLGGGKSKLSGGQGLAQGETQIQEQEGEESFMASPADARSKGQKGRALLQGDRTGFTPEKGFGDLNAEEFGLESYGLGESALDIGLGGQYVAPWLAALRSTKGIGNAINTVAAPLSLAGIAMKGVGDAVNPNEDIDWGELGGDAVNVGAMALMNKMIYKNMPTAQGAQLPGGSALARPKTKFSIGGMRDKAAAKFASRFTNVNMPPMQTQPAGLLPKYVPKLGGPTGSPAPLSAAAIEENFLMNLTDDLANLPIKRRGGVITKYRGF